VNVRRWVSKETNVELLVVKTVVGLGLQGKKEWLIVY
jgi:hypothetical protein